MEGVESGRMRNSTCWIYLPWLLAVCLVPYANNWLWHGANQKARWQGDGEDQEVWRLVFTLKSHLILRDFCEIPRLSADVLRHVSNSCQKWRRGGRFSFQSGRSAPDFTHFIKWVPSEPEDLKVLKVCGAGTDRRPCRLAGLHTPYDHNVTSWTFFSQV